MLKQVISDEQNSQYGGVLYFIGKIIRSLERIARLRARDAMWSACLSWLSASSGPLED